MIMTIPSILSTFRLVTAPLLVLLAWFGLLNWCFVLFLVLLLSDWLDGKLARLWQQQTTSGARLDSIADATFYGCVLIATGLLKPDLIREEMEWIAAALISYALSFVAALIKFGRPPSYHTWMAKFSWLLMSIAIVCVFLDWAIWPLRVAMTAVLLTNLEALAITWTLRERRVDVPTSWHALRMR